MSSRRPVARRIAAREVFALCVDGDAAEEEARRAASVWKDLPKPKSPLVLTPPVAGPQRPAF